MKAVKKGRTYQSPIEDAGDKTQPLIITHGHLSFNSMSAKRGAHVDSTQCEVRVGENETVGGEIIHVHRADRGRNDGR